MAPRTQRKPVRRTPKTQTAPSGPEFPTDEDLGIGVDDDTAEPDALGALLNDPRMAKLLDAAVAQRMAQLGGQSDPAPQSEAFGAFTQTLKHLIDSNAMQQPGYIKPLPADEIDRRLAGKVEMEALLQDYEKRGFAPLWTVGEGGFFECTNALEFPPGSRIRTYLPPAEDFIPENEPAHAVHAAMMQWLGGRTPGIGEQVEAAMKAANNQAPLVTGTLQADRGPGPVELVEAPSPSGPPNRRRAMGTITPERREVSLADRVGTPIGPAFADA